MKDDVDLGDCLTTAKFVIYLAENLSSKHCTETIDHHDERGESELLLDCLVFENEAEEWY